MKRLLIISAHFPPTNAVDMHRVRVGAPYYRQFGWEPSILCFHPDCTNHPEDLLLLESVPQDMPIERIRCVSERWTRPLGLGAVAFRGWWAMRKAALRQIHRERPDLILFSTTSFPLMAIGPHLQRTEGIPYVLDFQDPWISPEAPLHQKSVKARVTRKLHELLEPRTVKHAAGLISVSADYLDVLAQRYAGVADKPQAVIPFGAAKVDLEIATQNDCTQHWPPELVTDVEHRTVGVYAGAYVSTMEPMVAELFRDVKQALKRDPLLESRLRLWFIGSNYVASDTRTPVTELAQKLGVQSVVREWPSRLPYYDVLAIACRASFNLLFGSSSRGYNPSKLFGLLQTSRPILAFVQPATTVFELLERAGGARIVTVDPSLPSTVSDNSLIEFFRDPHSGLPPQNPEFTARYSAEATTELQTKLFRDVLERSAQQHSDRQPSAAA